MRVLGPIVLAGVVADLGPGGLASGIAKRPAAGPWRVTRLGLAADAQAERAHHGGLDKAIDQYPSEHRAAWRARTGTHELLAAPRAFGENLPGEGWSEETV